MYSLGTLFVSGIYVQIPCIKEIMTIIIITYKQNKYQVLANEIYAMWKQNAAQVIPIVTSTGVIPKSLSQSLKRVNLHPNTYIQMQRSVILGTCPIVRNFLYYKTIEPNPVDYLIPELVNISQLKLRSEKFDDANIMSLGDT
jgi:hypothetical protein